MKMFHYVLALQLLSQVAAGVEGLLLLVPAMGVRQLPLALLQFQLERVAQRRQLLLLIGLGFRLEHDTLRASVSINRIGGHQRAIKLVKWTP